jgi:transglutaminase/protease-like cytokinesis protein 3
MFIRILKEENLLGLVLNNFLILTKCIFIKYFMRRNLFVFLFVLRCIFPSNSFGQKQDYSNIDKYVRQISSINYSTIEKLTQKLIKPEWSDNEKVRAIFYWLAFNIKYDWEGYRSGNLSNNESPSYVYNFRISQCEGYSNLFNYICQLVGIESKEIIGYSRDEYKEAGISINKPNHTWNAVKINGNWYLLDVTWASTSAINSLPNDYYFLTPPEEFVANHLPNDEQWQLLKETIKKEEFDSFPFITSVYFELGLNKNFPKKGLLQVENNKVNFSLSIKEDYSILLKMDKDNEEKWTTPDYNILKNKDLANININLKEEGQYLLRIDILSNDSSKYDIHRGVMYFTLTN